MDINLILRIVSAALLGGIIGLEREYRAKEAGFRTHFLVGLGSALFMVVSQYGFEHILATQPNVSLDPSRIASQVVSGIGFIGAGTIIFQKQVIRGLTTAAGLWATAAIGLACGASMYVIAVASTVMVLACLETLNYTMKRFGNRNINLTFTASDKKHIEDFLNHLEKEKIAISSYEINTEKSDTKTCCNVNMDITIKRAKANSYILSLTSHFEGVTVKNIE